MNLPKCGQYLHSSCSGEDYGRIIKVGQDDNKTSTISIELFNADDICYCDDEDPKFPHPILTYVELPPNIKVILHDLQYRMMGEFIICNTPGNGCLRCTKLFSLCDTPSE